MTRSEIIDQVRSRLFDTEDPLLWSDADLDEYLNNIVNHLCDECGLIEDATTPSICQISVVADTTTYDIDSRIIRIKRAKLASQTQPLNIIRVNCASYMDARYNDWENADSGVPTLLLASGFGNNKVRLYPPRDTTDTLNMIVYRRPLVALGPPGGDKVANGNFTGNATGWTLAAGFTYNANAVDKDGDGTGVLEQDIDAKTDELYTLVFTISSLTVGTVTASIGGTSGDEVSANGTYTQYIRAVDTTNLKFTPSNTARFTIDTIAVHKRDVIEFDEKYHRRVYNGMMWLAYMKHDSQTFDPQEVQKAEKGFMDDINEIKKQRLRERYSERSAAPIGGLL
jgi:hypothetical protein